LLFLSQQSESCLPLPFGFVELCLLLESELFNTLIFNSLKSDSLLVLFGDPQLSLSLFLFLVGFELLDPSCLFGSSKHQLLELHFLIMDFCLLSEFGLFGFCSCCSLSKVSPSYSLGFFVLESLKSSSGSLFCLVSSPGSSSFLCLKLCPSFPLSLLVFKSLGSELVFLFLSKLQKSKSLLFLCSREFCPVLLCFGCKSPSLFLFSQSLLSLFFLEFPVFLNRHVNSLHVW